MEKLIMPFILAFKAILAFLYSYTHDWGWAIVALTVAIKLLLFPLAIKQTRMMEKMRRLQPKLKELQEKYRERPEELQRRTMELYQKEQVNLFGGCLPMLVQIPILAAIFFLLSNTKYLGGQIQNATFLWFTLQAKKDLILAALAGGTTFLQQKLTTPGSGSDPGQKMMMLLLPLLLGWFTYQVSAGVGLYWVTTNIVAIIQQYLINEYFIVKEHLHHEPVPVQPEGEQKPSPKKRKRK